MESLSIYFELDTFLDVNYVSLECLSFDSFEVNVVNADTSGSCYKSEQSGNSSLEYCSTSSNNSSLEFQSFKCCSSIDNTDNVGSRLTSVSKTEYQHLNCQHTTTTSRKSGSTSELQLSPTIFFRHVPTNVIEFLIFFGIYSIKHA